MEIVNTFSPNHEEIKASFDIELQTGIVFMYGNILYNPGRVPHFKKLIVHERVCAKQQEHSEEEQKRGGENILMIQIFVWSRGLKPMALSISL
jgi:hypothetical protein